jgi:ketosteroid isomerase-like protein
VSERNVEIIRGVFERWARGDFNTPEVFAPDVEFARYGGEVVVTREARRQAQRRADRPPRNCGVHAERRQIVRWETYWDADEGMRAVGLDL